MNFTNFIAVLGLLVSLTSGIFTHFFIKAWGHRGFPLPDWLKDRPAWARRIVGPALLTAAILGLVLGGLWFVLYRDEVRQYTHAGEVKCLAFAPDGMSFASAGTEPFVRIWETNSGRELGRLRGQSAPIHNPVFQIAFSPDGKLVAAGGESYVWVWDPAQGAEVWAFRTRQSIDIVQGLSFLPGGASHKLLVAWFGGLEIVDVEARSRADFPKLGRSKDGLAVSRDGRYAITSGQLAKDFELWDIENRQVVGRSGPEPGPDDQGAMLGGGIDSILEQSLSEHVSSLALGRNLRYLLTASHWGLSDKPGDQINDILVWDVGTWNVLRRFRAHEGPIDALAVSADDRYALSGSRDGTVALWDFDAGACLARYRGHQDGFGLRPPDVTAVAFHPKKPLALSAGRDGTVRLWQIRD